MRVFSIVVLILFLAAVAVFSYQNQDSVAVTFLNWSRSVPMPALILGVYVLGMISGWSVLSFLRRSWQRAVKQSG
jgi:uncharacterized integral membrane protein